MTNKRSQTYGLADTDKKILASKLANTLNIDWVVRDNLTWGIYYTSGELFSETFLLISNYNMDFNEVYERKFSDYPCLLFVDGTERPDDVRRILTEATTDLGGIILLSDKEAEELVNPDDD